jgi:hypothetical protein
LSGPWHLKQWASRIGRTSFSKEYKGSCPVFACNRKALVSKHAGIQKKFVFRYKSTPLDSTSTKLLQKGKTGRLCLFILGLIPIEMSNKRGRIEYQVTPRCTNFRKSLFCLAGVALVLACPCLPSHFGPLRRNASIVSRCRGVG